jgi:hypothetical protein
MKKILLSLLVLALSFNLSATKIDFETATLGTKANVFLNTGNSGDGGVIVNTVTNGINPSTQALRIAKSAYGNLNFPDLVLPEGAPANYAYWRIRCKIMPISGSGLDYPTIEFNSATNSTVLGTKIGQIGPWGGTTLNKWVQCDFIVSASALTTIPAGQLSIKFVKDVCEYAIDDIEIVPGPNVSVFKESFESYAIGTSGDVVGANNIFANPATTGINPTAQAVHKTFAGWGVLSFPNINLPEGTPATYPLTIVKCKILVIGGTDTGYPSLYFGSSTDNNLGTTIGKIGPWGDASIGTWVNCQYILNNSTLATIPAGHLTIKLEKNDCEYAMDDVELFSNVPGYSLSTGLNQTTGKAIDAFYFNNQIQVGQVVEKADVYDVNGRLLVSAKNTSIVNIANLGRGIYIVKLQLNGQNSVIKILK